MLKRLQVLNPNVCTRYGFLTADKTTKIFTYQNYHKINIATIAHPYVLLYIEWSEMYLVLIMHTWHIALQTLVQGEGTTIQESERPAISKRSVCV